MDPISCHTEFMHILTEHMDIEKIQGETTPDKDVICKVTKTLMF